MTALLDVDKLVRFSSSSIGADKLYKTLAYGLDAAAYFFAPTAQQETAQNIHALASNISMARYVLRLTGGLEAYTALKKGSWSCKDDDEHVQRLVRLQALSKVVYHPLEHVSYVGFVWVFCIDKIKSWIKEKSDTIWSDGRDPGKTDRLS